MSSEDVVQGLPSASFLPLNRYKFKRLTGLASVSLPIRGTYLEGSLDGEFDICPSPGVVLFGTLTQVMMAFGKYPTLSENQRFVMAGIELDGDNIVVTGRVVEML